MDSDFINTHYFLIDGEDLQAGMNKVNHFFSTTVLVKYDQVVLEKSGSCCALEERFGEMLGQAVALNRQLLEKLLKELAQEGFADLGRWHEMPQGYLSKTVHAAAHMLDGFFGVDSSFYNLVEDSHWVSDKLRERILQDPRGFWLIPARCLSRVADIDRVPFLRRHGRE